MNERNRLSIRAHRAEIEATERAEKERIEAPIREAEVRIKETHRQLHAVMVERLTKGKDDQFKIDPATFTPIPKEMTVDQFNQTEAEKFRQENPDYYPCEENVRAIVEYIDRNAPKIVLVSALQIAWAYKRLHEYGLIRERPAPEPEPELTPEPQPAQPAGPVVHVGIDWQTGREREFTQREVDRMSADEFKRAFRVAGTVAEVLTAMKEQRADA